MNHDGTNLRQELETLRANTGLYFSGCAAELGAVEAPSYVRPESDYYWRHLSEAQKNQATELVNTLTDVSKRLALLARHSPLIGEEDERDLSIYTKMMRAALMLRYYRQWDRRVLNDEDVVLGVVPAGQSEASPLDPQSGRVTFEHGATQLMRIEELLVTPEGERAAGSPTALQKVRRDTAFVMMWIDREHPELEDVKVAIIETFGLFGIQAVRSDEIEHEGIVTHRILNEISTAEFLIADLSGARPSVYYEVGYAHAIGKRVILYRKKGTAIHFDLAGYNCPEYENVTELKALLKRRLEFMTNRSA
jgi:hypothetical protein